jgi:hypothetical protein
MIVDKIFFWEAGQDGVQVRRHMKQVKSASGSRSGTEVRVR